MSTVLKFILGIIFTFSGYTITFSQDSIYFPENYIRVYNSKNWDILAQKLEGNSHTLFEKTTFLFIGDSHIQGAYITNRVRDLFREEGYKTGRGIIFPYKYAKKFGGEDIAYYSSAHWNYHIWKNTDIIKNTPIGYSISTPNKSFSLCFTNKQKNNHSAFTKITLFHSHIKFNVFTNLGSISKIGAINQTIQYTEIQLNQPLDSCCLNFEVTDTLSEFTLNALYLENENEQISMNAIGINGISLQYYAKVIDWQPWINFLKPDCIILALGTNDVYSGRPDTVNFKKSALTIIRSIKQSVPNATIILTTPNDHLIRRRYINKYIPVLCGVIKQIAKEENCAVWDFFSIMGGTGSSRNWYHKGYMFRDYIHLSKEGYKFQGELFYQAFTNSIKQNIPLKPINIE